MSRYIGMAQLVSPPSTCQKIFSLLGMLRNKTQVVVNMQRVEWLFRLSWFFLEQLCFQLHCWYRSSAAEKIAGGMNQGRGTKLCWWSVMDFSLRICGLKKKPRCHLRMSWMKHWKLGGGLLNLSPPVKISDIPKWWNVESPWSIAALLVQLSGENALVWEPTQLRGSFFYLK